VTTGAGVGRGVGDGVTTDAGVGRGVGFWVGERPPGAGRHCL
jgi:hypothetical protein